MHVFESEIRELMKKREFDDKRLFFRIPDGVLCLGIEEILSLLFRCDEVDWVKLMSLLRQETDNQLFANRFYNIAYDLVIFYESMRTGKENPKKKKKQGKNGKTSQNNRNKKV